MKAQHFLDTLGQFCPQPIIETAIKIKSIQQNQILEIISDDWGIIPDLQAWAKSTGNALLKITEEPDLVRAFVKKTAKAMKSPH